MNKFFYFIGYILSKYKEVLYYGGTQKKNVEAKDELKIRKLEGGDPAGRRVSSVSRAEAQSQDLFPLRLLWRRSKNRRR